MWYNLPVCTYVPSSSIPIATPPPQKYMYVPGRLMPAVVTVYLCSLIILYSGRRTGNSLVPVRHILKGTFPVLRVPDLELEADHEVASYIYTV